MAELAVSTWAIHPLLNASYPDSPQSGREAPRPGEGELSLLQVPAKLREHGYDQVEICHFHIGDITQRGLNELRRELDASGITLLSLLIDEGDVSHPEHSRRDAAWIEAWIGIAGRLGAKRARVIAGKQPWSKESSERSLEHLKRLARAASGSGVRLETENWFGLLDQPGHVFEMLDRMEGELGLCADFGNWSGPDKIERLARIFPRAETCHAKAEFLAPGEIDMEDYDRCLSAAWGFKGPYVLVSSGKASDTWAELDLQRQAIEMSA